MYLKSWLNHIIQALVDKGHIFKFEIDMNGYFIQA